MPQAAIDAAIIRPFIIAIITVIDTHDLFPSVPSHTQKRARKILIDPDVPPAVPFARCTL